MHKVDLNSDDIKFNFGVYSKLPMVNLSTLMSGDFTTKYELYLPFITLFYSTFYDLIQIVLCPRTDLYYLYCHPNVDGIQVIETKSLERPDLNDST